jgi:hypothetical protein
MHRWTFYIISMPSGGLVPNQNRNQRVRSALGVSYLTTNSHEPRLTPGTGLINCKSQCSTRGSTCESVSSPNAHTRCPYVLLRMLILHRHTQTDMAFPITAYSVLALSHQPVHHVSRSPRPVGIIKCEARPWWFAHLFDHDSRNIHNRGLVMSSCTMCVTTHKDHPVDVIALCNLTAPNLFL